jgi:hypothetical protein
LRRVRAPRRGLTTENVQSNSVRGEDCACSPRSLRRRGGHRQATLAWRATPTCSRGTLAPALTREHSEGRQERRAHMSAVLATDTFLRCKFSHAKESIDRRVCNAQQRTAHAYDPYVSNHNHQNPRWAGGGGGGKRRLLVTPHTTFCATSVAVVGNAQSAPHRKAHTHTHTHHR